MQMMMWNPWSIFDELQGMMAGSSEWPQFDVEDSEDETLLTADVPGMREEDVDVIVQGSRLIVRGERKPGDGHYVRRSRFYGTFERQFQLGDGYDLDHVEANLSHGVLRIRLVKAAKSKPRRIKLTSGVVDKVKGLLGGKKDEKEQRAA
jgi:HSP20 family protein